MGKTRTGLALGLVSASVICFEIGLTRLFSFFLHYHFTFLVLSGAVGGLGLGAVLAARLHLPHGAPHRRLALWAFSLTLVLWVATALLGRFPRTEAILLLAGGAPFVLAGIFLALVFRARAGDSQRLYFYDLTGAALGTLWIIPSLQWLGGIDSLLSAGCLAALGGGLLIGPRIGIAAALVPILLLGLHTRFPLATIDLDALGRTADKPLFKALHAAGHPGRLQQTQWSAYARTDLVDRTGETGLNIYMDGGAGSYMFRFGGDFRRLFFLRGEAAFFPYYFGPRQRALILGPGGGADVLYALMTGWEHIDGVEINPEIVDLVRTYGDYNGHLYDLANVDIHVGDGRNYLERTRHRYDLIVLPLVYAEAADLVGYALQENYLFTGQAMAAYLAHLNPDGRLGLVVHNHLLMLRVITTLAETWRRAGREPADLLDHLVVVNGTRAPPGAVRAHRPLILVQNRPYTVAQLQNLTAVAREVGLQFYYRPGQLEPAAIADLGAVGLDAFVAADRNIAPLTDGKDR